MSEEKEPEERKAKVSTAQCGCNRYDFEDGGPPQFRPCMGHALEAAGHNLIAAAGRAFETQAKIANLHGAIGIDPNTGLAIGTQMLGAALKRKGPSGLVS